LNTDPEKTITNETVIGQNMLAMDDSEYIEAAAFN